MNSTLVQIKHLLKDYHTTFKDENILGIGDNSNEPPFAYLIYDAARSHHLLFSVGVDYSNSVGIAEVAVAASQFMSLAQSDPFYISDFDGNTYFGDEAYKRWSIESIDMTKIHPVSEYFN